MPPPKYLAQANRLVAALPSGSLALFLDHCELVDLNRQDVLTQAGQPTNYAYFPIDKLNPNERTITAKNTGLFQRDQIRNQVSPLLLTLNKKSHALAVDQVFRVSQPFVQGLRGPAQT